MVESTINHDYGIDTNIPDIFITILLISGLFAAVWVGSLLWTAAIITIFIHHIIGMIPYFDYQGPKIVTLALFSTVIALSYLL